MKVLTEMPPIPPPAVVRSRGELRMEAARGSYGAGLLVAIGIHALIILAWPKGKPPFQQVEFDVEQGDASVEVSLVAAPPAEETALPVEQPPDPTPPPPPPEPTPETPPPPPVKVPEMTLPEPPPKPEPPKPRAEPPKPRAQKAESKPRPVAPVHAVGDGSSKIPGHDATTQRAASGALSAKPGYLRNPHPAYPEEARAAKQQGVVSLRVSVDASGHVVSVRVTNSSGFPVLDERARSTVAERWVFKPATSGGTPVPSEVVIPIRFTLEH